MFSLGLFWILKGEFFNSVGIVGILIFRLVLVLVVVLKLVLEFDFGLKIVLKFLMVEYFLVGLLMGE